MHTPRVQIEFQWSRTILAGRNACDSARRHPFARFSFDPRANPWSCPSVFVISFRSNDRQSIPGDGYTCDPESDVTTTDEPPKPQCLEEMCWCPGGWEYRGNECVPQEEGNRTVNYDRDCKYEGKYFFGVSLPAVDEFLNQGFIRIDPTYLSETNLSFLLLSIYDSRETDFRLVVLFVCL